MQLLLLTGIGLSGSFAGQCCAQWQSDLDRINAHVASVEYVQDYRHSAQLSWSWNPAKLLIRSVLFVYQREITYQMGSSCLYGPSCSEFSRRAFELYKPGKGLLLSIDRLMRCNRLSRPRNGEFEFHDHHFIDQPAFYEFGKSL